MASTVWNGSVDTDWNTAANWTPSGVPLASAHIQISTTNDCALDQNRSCASLTIDSGATIIGGGYKLTITSEGDAASGTEGFAVNNDGIISGNLDLEINTQATTTCDFNGTSGNFQNVKLNHASVDATFHTDTTFDGTLTIAAGTLKPQGGSSITVAGHASITGTFGVASGTGAHSFGSITINSGGTFIATSGETSITGAGGLSRAGTFTHNNGTVDFEAATTVIQDTTMTGSNAFYILKSTGTTWYRIDQDIDIERHASTGYVFWFYGNVTVTMGTDTYSSGTDNSNKCIGWSYVYGHTSSTYKLYAKNELYPWLYDYANVGNSSWINGSQDARMGIAHLKGGNIIGDFSIAETTNPKSIVLDGDMEFDGVTVGNTNTLDLNGQRAEFGGDVTYQGTWDADGLAVFHGGFTKYGTLNNAASGDIMTMSSSGTPTFSYITGYRTFFQNGGVQLGTGGFTSITNAIVAGTTNVGTRDTSSTNLTIPIGGIFQAEAKTHTVSGDFTISGGLIGKSALSFPDGGNSPTGAGNALDVPYDLSNLTGDATIEFWMKAVANDNDASRGIINGYRAGFDNRWQLNHNTNETLEFYSHPNNKSISVDLTDSLGKWAHIALVCTGTGGNVKLYINGKLVGQTELGSGVSLATPGAFPDFGLNRQDGSSNIRTGQRLFEGDLAMLRIWTDERTQSELRANMFATYANLASNTDCAIAYEFDEGTGTDVDDKVGSNNGTLINSVTWAGAGTFVDGTSTVDFTGNGEWAISDTTTNYYNVKVAASGKTTTIRSVGGSEKRPRITNLLTHGGGTLTDIGNADITFYSTGTHTAGADLSGLYITYWPSSTDIPGGTYQYLITQHNDLSCTGDINCGGYFAVSSGEGFDLKDNTLTTGRMILYANSTYNMDAGSLIFDSTSGMTGDYAGRTFTAGPGATISGVAAKSGFFSDNNYVVVGNIENLDVSNEELKVTGLVTNCIGPIHQYFPTIDHDQQIDADTADDRDIQLHGDKLDRNTELINS